MPKKCIANAHSAVFQASKQGFRPYKFGRKHAQRNSNGECAGSRQCNHHDARCKQRESEKNLEEPLGLSERVEQHFRLTGPQFGPRSTAES